MVSDNFKMLIALAAAGARGMVFDRDVQDWNGLFRLAKEQSVLPLLGGVVLKNPELACPAAQKEGLLGSMRTLRPKIWFASRES